MLDSAYLNEAKKLVPEWEQRGLLDGIKDPAIRESTAVLLENQKLLNELSTDTGDVANFKRISIPLVRRIYPQLIANKIVSVQPMLGPTGLVYYMRYRYSSNKGSVRGQNQPGFPGDDALSLQQTADGYANTKTWYSNQFVDSEVQNNAGGGTTLTYSLERTPIIAGTVTGSVYDGGVLVNNFAVSSVGTFTITDVGVPTTKVTGGSVNLVTGVLNLVWNNDPGANNVVVNYEQNLEGNQDIPEINMALESEDIQTQTRKLKAKWTNEVQQDLRSQHSIDVENEMSTVLAQQVNMEIDREVIGDLFNSAGTVSAWDYSTALGDTIKEKFESIFIQLVSLSNTIHKKTLRHGANWIIASPEVASIFESATAGFGPTITNNEDSFVSGLGIQYVGGVAAKWKLYKDPQMPIGQVLMGYKGESYLDSGYYYCPYVPLMLSPTLYGPEDFNPVKGVMVRYGKKLLREGAKYYARLNIQNFIVN